MNYCKPEITILGQAHRLIASNLLKGEITGDSVGDPSDMTPSAGYQADEE